MSKALEERESQSKESPVLVRVLLRNRTNERYTYMYTRREIYYKELTYMIMEADKF